MTTVKDKLAMTFGTLDVSDYARHLINEALEKNCLSCGKLVQRFEKEFAKIHGVPEAVAVSSGTDADILSLALLYDYGAERGDEVIVPALSFIATGNAVLHAGFKPVFVDVDPLTLNICPDQIDSAVTSRTRAIMPVHLMGKPAEMDTICAVAAKHGLFVAEDAAEAHGALYKGKPVGSIGNAGAFSTYVAHIISTVEGGVILVKDEKQAEILRSLRSHGRNCVCGQCVMNSGAATCGKRFAEQVDRRFTFDRIGYSCKMNEMEAAVGLGNIQDYHLILSRRYDNLKYGLSILRKYSPWLSSIEEKPYEKLGPHALPVIVAKDAPFTRDEFAAFLGRHSIDSRTLFASMPTQCAGFKFLNHVPGEFPGAEFIGTNAIHVGVHQKLTRRHFDYLDEVIAAFMKPYMS